MAATTRHSSANESCVARIPLFPLRYSAHPRPFKGDDYGYDLPTLEKGFVKLQHAQYGLRRVGGGFIYLFDETEGDLFVWRVNEDDGMFIELHAKHRSLQDALKDYVPGNSVRHIWARACSLVHLLLTDTLLTEQKIRDIQGNRDGVRDGLVTTIDMNAWRTDALIKHSFPAEQIGLVVEDFKGTDLSFSPWEVKSPKYSAEALIRGMKATAPAIQVAVLMFDHIALVQDLAGSYQVAREEMERYNAAPDETSTGVERQRHQKKMIAELIGRIYETAYAGEKGLAGKGAEAIEQAIERDLREQETARQRVREHSERMERMRARGPINHGVSTILDPISGRAEVTAKRAKLYARHIKEAERIAYLREYSEALEKRHRAVLDKKNDRCKWLESYLAPDNEYSLAHSFARYDTSDDDASTSHAVAFASCIEGMIWGTEETPGGVKDDERELFGKWWTLPWSENPILKNMDYDKGLSDAVWQAKKGDVAADLVANKAAFASVRYAAIHLIMSQVSVYTLSRFPNSGTGKVWNGAARDSVAERIHQLSGTGSIDDAIRLVNMLEQRYSDRIILRRMIRQEVLEAMEDAAGLPRGAIAIGSIAMGADDAMHVLVWNNLSEGVRLVNPFLRRTERILAGGVAFLSFMNFIQVALEFDKKQSLHSTVNLFGASMALMSGVNGLLNATRPLMPQVYLRASISGVLLRRISGVVSARIFGFAGAIADSVSQAMSSRKSHSIGNYRAATCYAIASLGMGVGGVALTVGGGALMTAGASMATTVALVPVWGWFVAGAILLGGGVWYFLKAESAQFGALNYWLNDCCFGKKELLGRDASEVVKYETLDDENRGYVHAMYAPQQHETEWHITSSTLTIKIAFPLEGMIPHLYGDPKGENSGNARIVSVPGEEAMPSGGSILTYRILGLTKGTGFQYRLRARYTPLALGEELTSHFLFTEVDAPWYY